MRRVIERGKARFAGDPRFDLRFADDGLKPRDAELPDDTALLHRICDAWCAARERQESAPAAYQPNLWWQTVQRETLGLVRKALASHNVDALRGMYRNFFRDRCGTGVAGLPGIVARALGQASQDYRYVLLLDALHRADLWRDRTGGRLPLSLLESPAIGNPYGVVLDGAFVRVGAPDQHFYAHRISELTRAIENPVVAEIGGGFGGMAYYLLRDCPCVRYIDFDVPETIALASYYLLSAFPGKKARLYGEPAAEDAEITLLPAFEMPNLPDLTVDVVFSSHVLADLPPGAIGGYMTQALRIAKAWVLLVDRPGGCPMSDELVRKELVDWNSLRGPEQEELECLYTRNQALRSRLMSGESF